MSEVKVSQLDLLNSECGTMSSGRRQQPTGDDDGSDDDDKWQLIPQEESCRETPANSASPTPSERKVRNDLRNMRKVINEQKEQRLKNCMELSLKSVIPENTTAVKNSEDGVQEGASEAESVRNKQAHERNPEHSVETPSQFQQKPYPPLRSKPQSALPPSQSKCLASTIPGRSNESQKLSAPSSNQSLASSLTENKPKPPEKSDQHGDFFIPTERREPLRRNDEATSGQSFTKSDPTRPSRNSLKNTESVEIKSQISVRFNNVANYHKSRIDDAKTQEPKEPNLSESRNHRPNIPSIQCANGQLEETVLDEGCIANRRPIRHRNTRQHITESNEDEVQYMGTHKNGENNDRQSIQPDPMQSRRRSTGSRKIARNSLRFQTREGAMASRVKRQKVRDSRNTSAANAGTISRIESQSTHAYSHSVFAKRTSEVSNARAQAREVTDVPESRSDVRAHDLVKASEACIQKALKSYHEENMGVVVLHYQGITSKILERLCSTLNEMTHISKLKLSNNKIDVLPDKMQDICVRFPLLILDMSGNRIERLPEWFYEKSNQLQHLNLSHNMLVELDPQICKLSRLEFLNLSNNQLRRLPKGLGRLVHLRILDVRSNLLEELPDDFGAENNNLICFDISDNPDFRSGLPLHFKDNFSIELQGFFFKGTLLYKSMRKKEKQAEAEELVKHLAGLTIEDIQFRLEKQGG